jgi:hypothetical protein
MDAAEGAAVLRGSDLHAWQMWRSVWLRDPIAAAAEQRRLGIFPYTDKLLRGSKKQYAQFVMDLIDRKLVDLHERRPSEVGAFFMPKKNGRLSLVLDTRAENLRFHGLWHSELPSAGAWSRLELPEGESLFLHQVDVDNAFYRIKAPPGMSEFFVLPEVRAADLRALGAASRTRLQPMIGCRRA